MDTEPALGPTEERAANELVPSQDTAGAQALSMWHLAKAALPDRRPLEDWERQAADDFFWSRF